MFGDLIVIRLRSGERAGFSCEEGIFEGVRSSEEVVRGCYAFGYASKKIGYCTLRVC
jgi:hypothetical protein